MIKCLNCGSTAQPTLIDTLWSEDGWTAYRINEYKCNCGYHFKAIATFECVDANEEVITWG